MRVVLGLLAPRRAMVTSESYSSGMMMTGVHFSCQQLRIRLLMRVRLRLRGWSYHRQCSGRSTLLSLLLTLVRYLNHLRITTRTNYRGMVTGKLRGVILRTPARRVIGLCSSLVGCMRALFTLRIYIGRKLRQRNGLWS